MADQQQQFYLLLGNLMSPDNNVRKQAEVRQRDVADLTSDKFGRCDKTARSLVSSPPQLPSLAARAASTPVRLESPRATRSRYRASPRLKLTAAAALRSVGFNRGRETACLCRTRTVCVEVTRPVGAERPKRAQLTAKPEESRE